MLINLMIFLDPSAESYLEYSSNIRSCSFLGNSIQMASVLVFLKFLNKNEHVFLKKRLTCNSFQLFTIIYYYYYELQLQLWRGKCWVVCFETPLLSKVSLILWMDLSTILFLELYNWTKFVALPWNCGILLFGR